MHQFVIYLLNYTEMHGTKNIKKRMNLCYIFQIGSTGIADVCMVMSEVQGD
jgi:hypothetical protein